MPHSEPQIGREKRSLVVEEIAAGIAMAVVCGITLINVVVRYFTDYSFGFTEEVSVFLLVFITLTGTAAAFLRGRHLAMTFVIDRAPRALQRFAGLIWLGVALVLFAAIAWYSAVFALDDFDLASTSPGIGVPVWLYSAWIPFLALAVCLRLIGRLRVALRRVGRADRARTND